MQKDIYNTIVVSENPRGRFQNGYIDGTPSPGTIMQIKAGTEPVGGRFTFEPFNRDASGNRPQGALAVLCENNLEGQGIDTAYVSGKMGQVYFPLPGDELLCLVKNIAGTGDTFAIGDLMIVEDGSGLLIATTTTEIEPFMVMETVGTALTANTLVHCQFTGY